MIYTAKLQTTPVGLVPKLEGEAGQTDPGDVVEGSSTGTGPPIYTFADDVPAPTQASLLARLEAAYEQGMHSTGSVGLVADMLYAMGAAAQAFGFAVVTPPETAAKADAELAAELAELPEGAIF